MRLPIGLAVALLAASSVFAVDSSGCDVERRTNEILEQMTLEEKLDLLGGVDGFDVRDVPRLGVPQMTTADGPFGVRRYVRANVMAGGIGLSATWNTDLARQFGNEIG